MTEIIGSIGKPVDLMGSAEKADSEHQLYARNEEQESDAMTIDMVNNPPHYTEGRAREVIDVMFDSLSDARLRAAFCLGTVLKYVHRVAKKGNPVEDLKKARWYARKSVSELTRSYGEDAVERMLSDERALIVRRLRDVADSLMVDRMSIGGYLSAYAVLLHRLTIFSKECGDILRQNVSNAPQPHPFMSVVACLDLMIVIQEVVCRFKTLSSMERMLGTSVLSDVDGFLSAPQVVDIYS